MDKKYNQRIDCTVCSCAYNDQGKRCSLDGITVCACKNCHTGNAEEESMCASYKSR